MIPICVFCNNFRVQEAIPGYSEMTPGSDAYMECTKDLVDFDVWNETTESYRQKMLTAVACPEFDPAQQYVDYLARGDDKLK